METKSDEPVLGKGYPVYRVDELVRRGAKHLPVGRMAPRTSYVIVDLAGRVAASDCPGWEGLHWPRLRSRIEETGGTIEEITRGEAEHIGTAQVAAALAERRTVGYRRARRRASLLYGGDRQ